MGRNKCYEREGWSLRNLALTFAEIDQAPRQEQLLSHILCLLLFHLFPSTISSDKLCSHVPNRPLPFKQRRTMRHSPND